MELAFVHHTRVLKNKNTIGLNITVCTMHLQGEWAKREQEECILNIKCLKS